MTVEGLNSNELILVLTTEKDYSHAIDLSKKLLRNKLASCINFKESNAIYWWEGQLEENNEVQLLIKTSQSKLSNLLLEIKKYHSYKIPELLFWKVKADRDYMNWSREVMN